MSDTRPRKLNLGCGTDIRAGYLNVDKYPLPGVDMTVDIEKVPLPFPDGSFEEILCNDILEHCDYLPVMRELHRILQDGGVLRIRVPHFTSKNAYTDPTHVRFFAFRTFDFFGLPPKGRSYYLDFHFSCVEKVITFESSAQIFLYNRLLGWWVNRSDRNRYLYESTGVSRLFPAENIIATLTK